MGETDTVIKFWFGDMGFTVSDPVLDLLSCFFFNTVNLPKFNCSAWTRKGIQNLWTQ